MRQLIYILFILSTLFIGLNAVYRLSYKADLPFSYYSEDGKIISTADINGIESSDQIQKIEGFKVSSLLELEFFTDTKHIGDLVELTVSSGSESTHLVSVRLTNYYKDISFILITLIVGLSFWVTGGYVFLFGRQNISARILCLTLVTFSLATFTSPCYFDPGNDLIGFLIRITHSVSYIFGGLFFLQFCLKFPTDYSSKQNHILKILYVFAGVFSIILGLSLYLSMRDLDDNYLKVYSRLWDLAQLFLLLSLVISTVFLIAKYKKLMTRNEKTKLEWLFWGVSAGAGPFIVFWLIPSIFGFEFYINEEILLSFLILIPISFSIAVVKYQLFNIEVVIKRSIVYSVLLIFMVLMYFGIIYGLSFLTGKILGEDSGFINITAVVVIALAFNPARVKLKNYVDKVFYRQKYSFEKAITELNKKITKCDTIGNLGDVLIREVNSLIPVNSIAVCILTEDGERLRVAAQDNFDNMSKYVSALRVKKIFSSFIYPFAVLSKIDKNINVDISLEKIFERWKISLGIPLTLESENVIGVILLGSKLSNIKYSSSDVELLMTIGSTASLALKRLELQERIIKEEMEIQNLKELDKMKSYFVATVSHDLKTPLSAIKIFSDLLGNENISKEKKLEYLKYIDGESDRLSRMINNILKYAKIEKGIKNYHFTKLELNKVLGKILDEMTYDLMMNKFEIENNISKEEFHIMGDNDDMISLFENLLSNVIKYSGKTKFLSVTTISIGEEILISIKDKGIGISEENLNEIFNPYFRGKQIEQTKIKGTGLGLAIVKNIVDAHGGKIEVKSEIGIGSTFYINLPKYINEN